MEQSAPHFAAKQKALEAFLQFGSTLQTDENCLMPLFSLPREYRNEINKGFSTGWECIDEYLQGIRKGELTVITADTGAGKTTFCIHLMINCAMQNVPVWINSWEMRLEVVQRKIASIGLRRPMKICNFSEHENEQFDEWASRYKVYINPNTIGTNIQTFAEQLILAKDLGIQIVMLDHLDYLIGSKHDKLHENIDETV